MKKRIVVAVVVILLAAMLAGGASAGISAGISRFIVLGNGMAEGNGESVRVIVLYDQHTMRQYLVVPGAGIIEIGDK